MKKLSWINKVLYFINSIVALLTFIGFVLPFLTPKIFPLLSVLTLALPVLLILNFLFLIYWLIQLKRQFILSVLILLIGMPFITKLYKLQSDDIVQPDENQFSIMSYNVHYFNLYQWLDKDVSTNISNLVKEQNPDILCFQEYHSNNTVDFSKYKYNYIHNKHYLSGHAIFSKYPMVNKGDIVFPGTSNNVLFVDLMIKNDTVRVYSMHLQSTKISDDINEEIDSKKSEKIFNRIGIAFKQQQHQAELINEHIKMCKFPIIICGDMNNSAFSYVYRKVKGGLNDCFELKGSGFGKTYNFKYYPARIDYIFSDTRFTVNKFQTFDDFSNSDHFPILSNLSLAR